MIKQYYRDNFNGTYSPDPDGGIAGIEFERNGKTYLTLSGTAWNKFDFAQRKAELVFKRFLKDGDEFALKSSEIKVLDDSKYMYGNPMDMSTFGEYEDFPYKTVMVPVLDDEGQPTDEEVEQAGTELKDDLITEAQFFINTIIQNRWNIPLGIGQFQFATIMRMEGISE